MACFPWRKTSKIIPIEALEKCSICLDPMYKDVHIFKCGHYVHTRCGLEWMAHARTCPLCRSHISDQEVLTAVVRYLR